MLHCSCICKIFKWCMHPLLHGLSPRILGFCPCWCPSPFPLPSISRCFSIHSFSLDIEFHLCFFFTTNVSAPIGRPITYSLFRCVSRLGTGYGTKCCGC